MKNNQKLRLHIFMKKIKDKSLKWKIRAFLFLITISTSAAIGLYSYQITRNELLANSKASVVNLIKQGGQTLDDKINVFKDVSYQITQSAQLSGIMNYTKEEAERYKTANEGLPSVIAQQDTLSKYIEFALLRPQSGAVYRYYISGRQKMNPSEEVDLLNYLDTLVDRHHVTEWMVYEGQLYFVRQIVDSSTLQEKGILCFAVRDEFLEVVNTDIEYLKRENIIVLNDRNEVLTGSESKLYRQLMQVVERNEKNNYYLYNTTIKQGEERYTAYVLTTMQNEWTIVCYFSHQVLFEGINRIFRAIIEVILFTLIIVLLITGLISRTITRNVTLIEEGMKHYEMGEFEHRISPDSYDEIGLLGLQLNYMALQISNLIDKLRQEEEAKKEMEIETLQAQINPHFLYNTLGSLQWAAYKKEEKETAASIHALSSLLRFTIKRAGKMVSVEEEIDYIKNYIAVEKVKYGDAIQVEYFVEEEIKDYLIPGFVLQPMIENSLIHGIDMAEKNGQITISVYAKEEFLFLEVADNGIGMSEEQIQELQKPDRSEVTYKGFNSIGIAIVDKRLKQMYGKQYQTLINSAVGCGTSVILKIPLGKGGEVYEM